MVGFAVLGSIALMSINKVKVNGELYHDIRDSKDIIADVLPPPMFVVEAHSLTYKIHVRAKETDSAYALKFASEIVDLTRQIEQFRLSFEERRAFWDRQLSPGQVRDKLLGPVTDSARAFFTAAQKQFVPAAISRDDDRLNEVQFKVLEPLFDQHLKAVNEVVSEANQWADQAETHANASVSFTIASFVGLSVVVILLVLVQSRRIVSHIMRPIDRLTSAMQSYMNGESTQRASIDVSDNEVAVAAIAFNQLADVVNAKTLELNGNIARLRQTEADLIVQATELERALVQANAASKAKSDFLANMSHELRTPLTAILGFTTLLESTSSSDDERKDQIQTIRRNGEHLLSLIGDILDISRIESGRHQLNLSPVNLPELCQQVVATFQAAAVSKSVQLVLDFDSPVPQHITADNTALRQVLINLVGNAIKFTQHGGVTLRVSMNASAAAPTLHFRVTDTGMGMTPEQLERLFKPFSQADNSITRKFGGTGLGLAISQKLAHLMAGQIAVASTPNVGSSFTFSLPISLVDAQSPSADFQIKAQVATEPSPVTNDKPLLGRKILYADDTSDNRALLKHLLKKLGATPTVVDGGQAALDEVEKNNHFDIILLDVQMPGLNGYDTARALRQRGITKPVMALTAHALPEDRQKCLAAGCDDYLTKPVDVQKLIRACRQSDVAAPTRIAA
jgi:signal transduction histidine kinase/ActR/RegA family two-component response regulator